jgi:hypothetical protein
VITPVSDPNRPTVWCRHKMADIVWVRGKLITPEDRLKAERFHDAR